MATLDQLERALVAADKAGDMDAARKLAAVIKQARQDPVANMPHPTDPTRMMDVNVGAPPPEPPMTDKAIGAGEAVLTTATGATTGVVGMVAGTLKGLAEQILKGDFGSKEAGQAVEQAAMKGARAGTYAPRSETGQEYVENVGRVAGAIPPVLPVMPEIAAATRIAAVPAVVAAGKSASAVKSAAKAASAVKDAARASAEKVMPEGSTAAGTPASAGAAAVEKGALRQAKADELPIPVQLTKGQRDRTFEQQRFERETAKDPELGSKIRDRFNTQNRQLLQNLDSFIDQTGAEAPDLRSIGIKVDTAIRERAARDKLKIRALYKEAEKAGELSDPVNLKAVSDYLNENRAGRTAAPIMQAIADEMEVQGMGAGKLSDGNLTTAPGTLKQAEAVRKAINRFTKSDNANDVRVASDLKSLIDQATEGAGGRAYKAARAARARYAKDYENIAIVRNILGNKRGSADRAIALEDVLNRSVISPTASLDDVRQIRRILQTSGENGNQAWRELQGGTLKYIKDEATKNVARSESGDPILSAAQLDRTINALDKGGKLDFIFGKKGAEQLRTINDVAKDVLVATPGSVNTSNTASVLLAALDIAISGTAGVPAPILSGIRMTAKGIRNAKTKARVKAALGE